ncbi:hypothetical protein DM02DRAFT_630717 [Periconia macrospinosa]|uniref:Peptidase S33 tripeptidyl aminopeptidase-like C-terminal domain-containing protein n=1 Tax=Periconia macrospinosa TaxID=97972 RepID=A0A2V1DID3_9PLEO|nr:hypothetical protein DM02DRAFT_630717 [Periconia macrospinosa]
MLGRPAIFLTLLATHAIAWPLTTRQVDNSSEIFFDALPLSKDLNYVPCFQNFTCTKLEVPLDYEDPAVGSTHIALMRWNSPHQPALGDVIFNPGGPGFSAIDQMMKPVWLNRLSGILGGKYNIVALEPRGVKYSGPDVNCFGGNNETEQAYLFPLSLTTWADRRERAKLFETAGAFGTWCSHTLNNTANYVNTPAVARDMLHYSELLAKGQGKPCNESKVEFYGNSYGSTLGMTFAQLYPSRVGHFLIDAVVDLEDHYFGNWSQNLLQANEAIEGLFSDCAEAGPACPLYRNGSTGASIKKRVDDLLLRLADSPITAADPKSVSTPITVDDAPLRPLFRDLNYNPATSFPELASRLAQLERGNASAFDPFAIKKGSEPIAASDLYGGTFTKCLDNNKHFEGTLEAMEELFTLAKNLSPYFGEFWVARNILECRTLKFAPPPSQRLDSIKRVKTATPLLFTDNTIDGLSSSHDKMSTFFEGSGIVLQKAIGHGIMVARSNCTEDHIRKYMDTGKVPLAGIPKIQVRQGKTRVSLDGWV